MAKAAEAKPQHDAPEWAAFYDCLRRKGLRRTSQRDTIFDVFMRSQKHLSSEDLYRRVREMDPKVGFTTVYRTLNLLSECGLAIRSQFGDGLTRYEPGFNTTHHDHLICVECGNVTEFFSAQLEHVQDEIVSRHGFEMQEHSLRIWGMCRACRRNVKSMKKPAASLPHRHA
ncbi:MAG: transcriptional repressor [Acidobacteria bacterium]|nr:transcriptional repressor [Acidobacteriota bacterium]